MKARGARVDYHGLGYGTGGDSRGSRKAGRVRGEGAVSAPRLARRRHVIAGPVSGRGREHVEFVRLREGHDTI